MILTVLRIFGQILVGCPSIGNGSKQNNFTVDKPDNTTLGGQDQHQQFIEIIYNYDKT